MRSSKNPFFAILLFLTACSIAPAPTNTATLTQIPPSNTPTFTAVPPTATATPTPQPTATPYPPVKEQLGLGDNHTCRLHPDGDVSCWGWNQFGQAGQPISSISIEEMPVPGLHGIVTISAGAYHTCALDWNGQIWCWGRNNVSQLGDESQVNSAIPVQVHFPKSVKMVALSTGSVHSCAIEQSGQVYCWGSNRDGKLGTGTSESFSGVPEKVKGLPSPIQMISLGSGHTCALGAIQDIWCWGDGSFGQIGLNPFASSANPVKLATFTQGVVSLQAGWFHTCVLLTDGSVKCWGKNQEGELGNAALISRADPVSPVAMDKEVTLLAVGGQTSCVLAKEQQVFCWGRNHHGQVGDQTLINRLLPTIIKLSETPAVMYLGGSHACEISVSNKIVCWGADDLNQLGTYSLYPVEDPTQSVTP
jgi:alpha-tubulin suppressor-like RCC1 family protein